MDFDKGRNWIGLICHNKKVIVILVKNGPQIGVLNENGPQPPMILFTMFLIINALCKVRCFLLARRGTLCSDADEFDGVVIPFCPRKRAMYVRWSNVHNSLIYMYFCATFEGMEPACVSS